MSTHISPTLDNSLEKHVSTGKTAFFVIASKYGYAC